MLPASLNGASVRMMPNTSCERTVVILSCVGSGRCMVSLEPDAVTICCSFVPANCPKIACVTDVGGWMVREYMNIELVVAIVAPYMRQSLELCTNIAHRCLLCFLNQ